MKTVMLPKRIKEDVNAAVKRLAQRLKVYDAYALAHGLASVLIGMGAADSLIETVVEEVKQNSEITRTNKKIMTRNKKLARLKELAGQKTMTMLDVLEAEKLMKALGD